MLTNRSNVLGELCTLAVAAGEAVWDHFQAGNQIVDRKSDQSPVTAADRAAEAIILAGLAQCAPGIAVIAEEEVAAGRIPSVSKQFFLVDPLDGTKEFISGGTDFTVNIGLIEDGAPTLGVVYAPARSALYWGDVLSRSAFQAEQAPRGMRAAARPIAVRPAGADDGMGHGRRGRHTARCRRACLGSRWR